MIAAGRWPVVAGALLAGAAMVGGLALLGNEPLWHAATDLPAAPALVPPPVSDPAAVALIRSAQRAATRLAYEGVTRTTSAGTRASAETVRVVHVPGSGTSMALNGPNGGASAQWVPDDSVGLPSSSVRYSDSATVSETDLLVRNYRLVLAGQGMVAGRRTSVVQALRADGSLAARFEVDARTGLLLRRVVYGADALDARFVSIRYTLSGSVASHPAPSPDVVDAAELAALRRSGWVARDVLPGGFALFQVRQEQYAGRSTLHLVYSDGLAVISLFEQPGHLDPSALPGFSQGSVGGTTVWWRRDRLGQRVWQSGPLVVTVMGDVSTSSLENVVDAIPGSRIDDGHRVTDRLRRGVRRVLVALHLTEG